MTYRLIIDGIESKKEAEWLNRLLHRGGNPGLGVVIEHMNEAHGQGWEVKIEGTGPDEPQHEHLKHAD